MRQICDTLGFHKSTFYYQPKIDPSEDVLRAEIETLAARYPTYGYRRITALLLRQGYPVGYKRVARLMKERNLWVSVKRAETQTTRISEKQDVEVGLGQACGDSNPKIASGGETVEQLARRP